jgi:hypothetical protein
VRTCLVHPGTYVHVNIAYLFHPAINFYFEKTDLILQEVDLYVRKIDLNVFPNLSDLKDLTGFKKQIPSECRQTEQARINHIKPSINKIEIHLVH